MAGEFDEVVRVKFDLEGLRRYEAEFNATLARINAKGQEGDSGGIQAGESLSNFEAALTEMKTRVAAASAEMGAELSAAFNFAIEGSLTKIGGLVSGGGSRQIVDGALFISGNKLQAGYEQGVRTNAGIAGAAAPGDLGQFGAQNAAEIDKVQKEAIAQQAAAEKDLLAGIAEQIVETQKAVDAQKFFNRNLLDAGGLAQQLLALEAEQILLNEQRSAALKLSVEALRRETLFREASTDLPLTPPPRGGLSAALQARIDRAAPLAEAEVQVEQEQLDAEQRLVAVTRERIAFAERAAALEVDKRFAAAEKEGTGIFAQPTTGAQRFQANLFGGEASDKSTLGGLFGGNLLRTGGYIATGAAIFGGLTLGRNIFDEAEKLQTQMVLIKSTMEETGQGGTDAFNKVSDSIINVSKSTATAADQVAELTRRLAGVYANQEGVPDFAKGAADAQTALQLATVAGIPKDEITNDLVAISQSFDVSFSHIGDTAIGLARDFAGSSADIIKFTGSLAPMAADLGFTSDQLAAFGAVAQEFSGQSSQTLTAEFTRVLPAIQGAKDKVLGLFSGDQGVASQMAKDFSQNNIRGVLIDIIHNYGNLSTTQQDTLNSTLGLRRGADALYSVFEHGDATLKALNISGDEYAGLLGQRFGAVQGTLQFQLAKLGTTLTDVGAALLSSGLVDGFAKIAEALTFMLTGVAKTIDFFAFLNDHLGGIPGELLGIAVGLTAVAAALKVLNAVKNSNILSGVLPGVSGGGEVPVPNPVGFAVPGATETAAASAGGGLLGAIGGGGLIGFLSKDRIGPSPLKGLIGGAGVEAGEGGALASGIAGLATIAAPVLAVAAVAKLNETVDETGKSISSAQDNLRKTVVGQLDKGMSPAEIRRRLDASGTSYNVFDKGIAFVTGNDVGGASDVTTETINDWLGKQNKDRIDQQIKAIIDYYHSDAYKKSKYHADDKTVATLTDKLQSQLAAFDDDQGAHYNEIQGTIAGFQANADLAPVITAIAKGSKDKATLLQAAQDSINRFNTGDLKTRIDAAQSAYQSGRGSLQSLLSGLDEQRSDLQLWAAAVGKGTQDYANYMKQSDDIAKQESDIIAQAAQQDQQNADAIASFTGKDTPKFRADQGLQRLQTLLNDPRVAPAAVVSAGLDIATQQRKDWEDAINRETNQFGVPLDAIQKAERLREGYKLTPEARKALDIANLLTTQNVDALAPLADTLGVSLDQLANTVVDQMIQTGKDAKTIIIDNYEAQKKMLEAKKWLDIKNSDSDAYAADAAAIRAINHAEDVVNAQDVGPTAGPSADDKANADATAAQTKRQNAQSEANARLDIQAAKSKGNALALAQIAQQRAQLDYQFAGSTADQLAAQAKMIEADQAVTQANLDHNKALRDLFVAQSGDDPIKAAQEAVDNALDIINSPASGPDDILAAQAALARANKQGTAAQVARNKGLRDVYVAQSGDDPIKAAQEAIDNANEAAASASNPDEWLSAQAALLRAQKTMAEAVRAGIDGQFDLLIAVDTFNGDAVKAAKDTLAKLQARLSDPNLKLSDADRAQLQAQIQNQELQVSQTQISQGEQDINNALELGTISKAQAIAQLAALKQFAVNQREITEIDLEIKRLRDQLGQDFKFNLPTVLGLPTLYEARRTSQDASLAGSTGYNDNRTITITVVAQTNADPNQIAAAVQSVMGPPQTYGVSGRRY